MFHLQAHVSTNEELHKIVEIPAREVEDVNLVLKVLALMCDSQIADIQVRTFNINICKYSNVTLRTLCEVSIICNAMTTIKEIPARPRPVTRERK